MPLSLSEMYKKTKAHLPAYSNLLLLRTPVYQRTILHIAIPLHPHLGQYSKYQFIPDILIAYIDTFLSSSLE